MQSVHVFGHSKGILLCGKATENPTYDAFGGRYNLALLCIYLKHIFFGLKTRELLSRKTKQKIKEIIIWRRLFGLLRSFVLLLLYLADRRCIPKCSTSNIHQSFFVCLFINLIIRKLHHIYSYNCKYKYKCKY